MPLRVLTALDKAKIQKFHFLTVLIAGLGFFTDAYDLFAIISITNLLGRLYYFKEGDTEPGTLPAGVYGALTGMAYCGAFCGQLFFGWAGDRLGRRRVYGITLTLMMVCSINCGLSYGRTTKGVITTLIFFRFWLGFGVGGDYPLSATIMSEFSNKEFRGAFIAAVFAMQGFGLLAAAAVTLILAAIFKTAFKRPPFDVDPVRSTPSEADFLWRTVFILGALPALVTYYFRMRIPETARYTALVLGRPVRATRDMQDLLDKPGVLDIPFQDMDRRQVFSRELGVNPKFGLFSTQFANRHGKELFAVSVSWFLVDVVFYGLNLYQKDMFTSVGWLPKARNMSALEETFKSSRAQALLALVATVPGYWVTVLLIDKIGRKKIQLLGFAMMAFFMIILAGDFKNLRDHHPTSFVALYALTFFFANFGPNATTFIIPAELFPARLRTRCNGIAAAAGKAGAIVGAFGIIHQNWTGSRYARLGSKSQIVLGLIALCNFIGFGVTFLLPETNGISLETLSREDGPEPIEMMTNHDILGGPNDRNFLLRSTGIVCSLPSSGEVGVKRNEDPASAAHYPLSPLKRSKSQ